MASSAPGLAEKRSNRGLSIVSWVVTIAACIYFIFSGVSLILTIRIFAKMFESMRLEPPGFTRWVTDYYPVLCPLVFGGATALVFAKEFFVKDAWARVALTLAAVVVVNIAANTMIMALYRPLLELIQKLS